MPATRVAITREVSSAIADCELTHLPRVRIDVDVARAQHRAYEEALAGEGCAIERLPATDDMPDSVFVEDIAVVFDELAVLTRPGAASRRPEMPAVAAALARHRPVRTIEAPGTMDGGDVLVIGTRVFVGLSSRTNADAIAQMRRMLGPLGYTVCEARVNGCLHLKSAVTAIAADAVLLNPAWIATETFAGYETIEVDPAEPAGANALRVGEAVIYPAAFPRTGERLAIRGVRLHLVDASELAKAEGAVTCCSVIFTKDTKD
jgi:dimethylargininase